MRLLAFSCRQDESVFFERYAAKYGVELVMRKDAPSLANAELAATFDGISCVTTPVSAEVLQIWRKGKVRALSTRTVGFDHIDLAEATRLGIAVYNVSYTYHSVAEYTIMSILMVLRKVRLIMLRALGQDYSLKGSAGQELFGKTVGIIGTGIIGSEVARLLKAFGCTVLATSRTQKADLAGIVEYLPLEQLLERSDIVTLHTPATPETVHLLGKEQIACMKEGAILINTARGSLVDTSALIEALETGKLKAAALDVVEGEGRIFYRDLKGKTLRWRELALLSAMPNVVVLPHMAFYTEEAVSDMVEFSVRSLVRCLQGEEDCYRINS